MYVSGDPREDSSERNGGDQVLVFTGEKRIQEQDRHRKTENSSK